MKQETKDYLISVITFKIEQIKMVSSFNSEKLEDLKKEYNITKQRYEDFMQQEKIDNQEIERLSEMIKELTN